MTGPDPAEYGWWLASRAAGVVALLCIAVSIGLGLAMAGRMSRGPGMLALHRQTALVGLVAIAVHGITLLGDRFLAPSIGDLALPFTSTHEPVWTGLGVTGAWLAAILGLSYWIRDRMRAGLWRRLHRATILVYVLSVAHAVGAGTDAGEPWLQLLLVATGAPILFLFVMRVLTPATAPVFRRYRVAEVTPESSTVCSFELVPVRRRLPAHAPGQFVTVRSGTLVRSYSLSSADRVRISVKREPGGRMSEHLHAALDVGATVEVAGPAGAFVLGEHRTRPLVLVSAGIGATPVLAMLHALPLPLDADFRLCGTPAFVTALTDVLPADRVLSESFAPNLKGSGPFRNATVGFTRSGVTARWEPGHASLLELAEANGVPTPSGCRAGACQSCRAPVLEGTVRHHASAQAPPGSALLCCAVPEGDVLIDA